MTHLLLFTAFVLWYADFEAKDDAQEIAEHIKIDHTHQWIERAVAFFCAWFITWIICSLPSTWPVLLGHAFLFSAVFRVRLNKRRGLPWWYIGGTPFTSAHYDRLWWNVRLWAMFLSLPWTWTERRWWFIESAGAAAKCERQVSRIAYLTEITLFALGTAGAIMLL